MRTTRDLTLGFLVLSLSLISLEAESDTPQTTPGSMSETTQGAVGSFVGLAAAPGAGFPRGLDTDGEGHLLVGEVAADTVHLMSTGGGAAASSVYPCILSGTSNPDGVATDGTTTFALDPAALEIDLYDEHCEYLSSINVSAQTTFPEGLTFDPVTGSIFLLDPVGAVAQLHEYSVQGAFLNTYDLGSGSGDGVGYDRRRCSFWVYSASDDLVRQYDAETFTLLDSFQGPLSVPGLSAGEGVAIVGDRLYIATLDDNLVAKFDLSAAQLPATCGPIFVDGFESGDTSSWSSLVELGRWPN